MTQRSRRGPGWRAVLAALALAACAGCGLSDYDHWFEIQQRRVAYLEKENRVLGPPVELPGLKDPRNPSQTKNPPDVFFRVPKGTSFKPEETPAGGALYHFAGAARGIQDVFLEVASNKNWDEFQKSVLQSFRAGSQNLKDEPAIPSKDVPPGRQQLPFRTGSFKAGAPPSIYFASFACDDAENYQVAVVFRVDADAAETKDVQEQMSYSLKSLAVGRAAREMRQSFSAQKRAVDRPGVRP